MMVSNPSQQLKWPKKESNKPSSPLLGFEPVKGLERDNFDKLKWY